MYKAGYLIILLLPSFLRAQSAEEYFDAGFEFYEAGEYYKAIDAYSKAIEIKAEQPKYYFHRGVCLSMISQNEEAVEDLSEAIRIDTTSIQSGIDSRYFLSFERAFSKYRLKLDEEAIKDYDRTIELNPDYGPAYLNRGTIKFDHDDVDGACYDWRKAFNLGIEIANELIRQYCTSKT